MGKLYAHLSLSVLVSCDHVPRRSWPLFRAKAMLDELIALSGEQSGIMAAST